MKTIALSVSLLLPMLSAAAAPKKFATLGMGIEADTRALAADYCILKPAKLVNEKACAGFNTAAPVPEAMAFFAIARDGDSWSTISISTFPNYEPRRLTPTEIGAYVEGVTGQTAKDQDPAVVRGFDGKSPYDTLELEGQQAIRFVTQAQKLSSAGITLVGKKHLVQVIVAGPGSDRLDGLKGIARAVSSSVRLSPDQIAR